MDYRLPLRRFARVLLLAAAAMGCNVSAAAAQDRPLFDGGLLAEGPGGAQRVSVAPSTGEVYVLVPTQSPHVRRYTASGQLLGSWGEDGPSPGAFRDPSDVAVDAGGAVYVADPGNQRVQKFAADGTLVDPAWGGAGAETVAAARDGTVIAVAGPTVTRYRGDGSTVSQMALPASVGQPVVAVAPDYDIYVSGNLGVARVTAADALAPMVGMVREDGQRPRPQLFESRPAGLDVTSADALWVADPAGHRILQFDNAGIYRQSCGAQLLGSSFMPTDVAIGRGGDVYVVSAGQVRRFLAVASSSGERCLDVSPRISALRVKRTRTGRLEVRVESAAAGAVGVELRVARRGYRRDGKCFVRTASRDAKRCRTFTYAGVRDLTADRPRQPLRVRFGARRGAVQVLARTTDARGITSPTKTARLGLRP